MSLKPGNILEGKVINITKFGAFVEVEDKIGLLHISEISKTFIKEVSDHLKENDVVKVKVISIDDNGKISLSMKQVDNEPERKSNKPVEVDWNKEKQKPHADRQRPSTGNFEDSLSKFLKESEDRIKDTKQFKAGAYSSKKRGTK